MTPELKKLVREKDRLLTKLGRAKDEDTRGYIEEDLRDLDVAISVLLSKEEK